jgi:hypothetical protein
MGRTLIVKSNGTETANPELEATFELATEASS